MGGEQRLASRTRDRSFGNPAGFMQSIAEVARICAQLTSAPGIASPAAAGFESRILEHLYLLCRDDHYSGSPAPAPPPTLGAWRVQSSLQRGLTRPSDGCSGASGLPSRSRRTNSRLGQGCTATMSAYSSAESANPPLTPFSRWLPSLGWLVRSWLSGWSKRYAKSKQAAVALERANRGADPCSQEQAGVRAIKNCSFGVPTPLQRKSRTMSEQRKKKNCKSCEKSVLAVRPGINHVLHLLLSIITVGLWIPVWIAMSIRIGGWKCPQCGSSV